MQMLKEHQDKMNKIFNNSGIASIIKQNEALSQIAAQASAIANLSKTFSETSSLMKSLNSFDFNPFYEKVDYSEINSIVHKIAQATELSGLASMFKDVTFDSLSAFDEIENDILMTNNKDDSPQNGYSELSGSTTVKSKLVGELTVDEFKDMMETGQSAASKDLNPKDRIKNYLSEVLKALGVDVGKGALLWFLKYFFLILHLIATSNHDIDVSKEVSKYISKDEQVASVRKVFVNNTDLEQPIGNMAFLRVSSQLRHGTSKGAPIVSQEVISKNTVVIPIEKKGNWIKVQVETIDGFYTGWLEESKIVKFKLNK
jgi:hypothetical protein